MKLRIASAVSVVWLLTAAVAGFQNRPSFTGTWRFVADKSTPANAPALGGEFRISHEANALVLVLPTKEFVRTADGKLAPVADGVGAPMAFKTDGDDHVMLPLDPMQEADNRTSFNAIAGGRYRVTWKGNVLLISATDDLPIYSRGTFELVHRLVTTAFSMNPDGTLLVERTAERDPATKGQLQYKGSEQKSLYVRAVGR